MPLVEAGETEGPGTEHFLHRYLDPLLARARPPKRLLLGCTHYPLLLPGIRKIVPPEIEVLAQGEIVASRLADWLARHPEQERRLGHGGGCRITTTDDPNWFADHCRRLFHAPVEVERVRLERVSG